MYTCRFCKLEGSYVCPSGERTLQQRDQLLKKDFASIRANSFLTELTPVERAGKKEKETDRVSPLKVSPFAVAHTGSRESEIKAADLHIYINSILYTISDLK